MPDTPKEPAVVSEDDRRIDTRLEVQLWVDQEHRDERSFCHAADLSTGGLRFDCGLPHAVGAVVNLRFTLPGEAEEIRVRAEVVGAAWRENRPVTHMRFLDLSGDDHIRIARFIEARAESQD